MTLFTFPRLADNADYSFGANHDPGRRVIGKIRGGVIGECKKEFERTIFASLETSIKLAKGTVISPVSEDIEQVPGPPPSSSSLPQVFELGTPTPDRLTASASCHLRGLSVCFLMLMVGCTNSIMYQ